MAESEGVSTSGYAPVTFTDDYRKLEGVESVNALCLDFDDGDFDPVAWKPYLGVAHTTRHHCRKKGDKPALTRWRVMLLLSRPVTVAEHAKLWQWAADMGGGTVDPSAKDASRLWFYPPNGAAVVDLDGTVIDVDVVLKRTGWGDAVKRAHAMVPAGKVVERWARKAIEDETWAVRGTPPGGRNNRLNTAAFNLGQIVAGGHLGQAEVERELTKAAAAAGLTQREALNTIRSGLTAGMRQPRGPLGEPQQMKSDVAVETSAPPVIELLTGPELAGPLPELEYLVEEIAFVTGGGAPHLVAGYGYTGKTLAMQSLLLALAAGQQVWGQFDAMRRRVLHVDFEQGSRLTKRRYQRLAKVMGVELASLGDTLAVADMPPLSLSPEHYEAWQSVMVGRDVMVVDSLRAATAGTDENDSRIRAGLDMLGAASNVTGCRPVVIHHARKPSKEEGHGGKYTVRGSSAIFDACDSVVVFTADRDEPTLVECQKARSHGELPGSFGLVIEDVGITGVKVDTCAVEAIKDAREARQRRRKESQALKDVERVRDALKHHPDGVNKRELGRVAKLPNGRVTAAVDLLGDTVAKEPTSITGGGKEVIYRWVGVW